MLSAMHALQFAFINTLPFIPDGKSTQLLIGTRFSLQCLYIAILADPMSHPREVQGNLLLTMMTSCVWRYPK